MTTRDVIPFSYVVRTTIPANSTSAKMLTMNADSEFELHTITAHSELQDPSDVNPNCFGVKITDLTTGRQLTNVRIDQALIAGNANYSSFMQKRPVRFLPNSNIEFDFAPLSSTVSDNQPVELVLHGYKIML